MNNLRKFLAMFVILSSFSCEQNPRVGESPPPENTSITSTTEPGVLNGDLLTFAFVSDSLDEGLTMESAKKIFGENPLVMADGSKTVITYAVGSRNLYENGVRITTLTLEFENGILTDASVGFTTYSD